MTGARPSPATSNIIAIRGRALSGSRQVAVPPLSNRDRHICAYCARAGSSHRLTRAPVIPVSQGGRDLWMNVVTACRSCNEKKIGRTPEQAKMQLVYAPYVPNKSEHLALRNRNILPDQTDFLGHHLPSRNGLRAA